MLSFSAQRIGSLAFCTSTAISSAANAEVANSSAKASTLARRIHIPGIHLHRQIIEPPHDGVRVLPLVMHQGLALAQRPIVAEVAQRMTARYAGAGDVTLDRGKFKRQRCDRLRQPGKRLGLEALHIDFDECWKSVP